MYVNMFSFCCIDSQSFRKNIAKQVHLEENQWELFFFFQKSTLSFIHESADEALYL